MTIAIQKGRAIVLVLAMAVAITMTGILSPALPKAHAGNINVAASAVVWADYPCITFWQMQGVNFGSIVLAHSEVQRWNKTLSSQEAWSVVAIGVTTGCSEGMGVLAQYVPNLAPYFGPWMFATRSSNGLAAAWRDRGQICGVLTSQGGEAAVNSMTGALSSYPSTPMDAKKAAIGGTIAFCPWNLGILRSYYGG